MIRVLIPALLVCTSTLLFAEAEVDLADSLNFEEFHRDKDEPVKVFEEKKKTETTKVYEPADTKTVKTEKLDPKPKAQATATTTTEAAAPGKRFEIRERYSLGRSTTTPYSAFYVIEALHKQMAQLCPNGWRKLQEFTVPVEQDFYLHYELECR